jgi:hypothetical protein
MIQRYNKARISTLLSISREISPVKMDPVETQAWKEGAQVWGPWPLHAVLSGRNGRKEVFYRFSLQSIAVLGGGVCYHRQTFCADDVDKVCGVLSRVGEIFNDETTGGDYDQTAVADRTLTAISGIDFQGGVLLGPS